MINIPLPLGPTGLSGLPGLLSSLWAGGSSPFVQKLKSWVCAHSRHTGMLDRGSRIVGPTLLEKGTRALNFPWVSTWRW